MAIPLDRTRPLWEMWTIDGHRRRPRGLLTKVHHAAIDGASGEELMVAILDLEPDPEPRPAPEVPWTPDPSPPTPSSISLRHVVAGPATAAGRPGRSAHRSAWPSRSASRTASPTSPRRRRRSAHPTTSLNGPLTPERSFAASSLSLTAVKRVKNAFGCTVNDVVLTMCAGALRRYLDERDEHPDGPLVAMVPVSVRTEDQKGTHGNQVSMMLTSLATDLDDPVERLDVIHASTVVAKEQQNAIGADTLQEWAEFAAPAIFGRAARLYSNTRSADRHRPIFNVTISNVPGPPFPLYVAGAQVLDTYPMGPIFDGGGLNITLMSYLDRIDFGLVACPDLVAGRVVDRRRAAARRAGRGRARVARPRREPKARRLAAVQRRRRPRRRGVDQAVSLRPGGRARSRRPRRAAAAAERRTRPRPRPLRGVAGARPEEPAQAVLAVAGHHVGVQVGLALADPVVDGHERSRRAQHRPPWPATGAAPRRSTGAS